MIAAIGVGLCLVGLGLVAFGDIRQMEFGGCLVLSGVIWLLLYMVLHKESWENNGN